MQSETHAQIIRILDAAVDMTLATVRPDGFPQATVVTFVHDDLMIYFATEASSQKAQNIARDDKVSLTITPPYETWLDIEGISLGGHARRITDAEECARIEQLMLDRFPQIADVVAAETEAPAYFRIDPVVISLLDYGKGFGHTELIEVQERLAPA